MPSLYTLLGGLLVAAGLAIGAFFYGVHVTNDHWKAQELVQAQAAQAQILAEVKKANDAEAALIAERGKEKIVYRDVVKTVDRIVTRRLYRNVCLDADGLRAANSALAGTPLPAAKPH